MATYRTIASTETDPQSPVTAELMVALANNPTAISEGASGAPTMEVAWHEVEAQTLGADGDTITFSTDVSVYRAIQVVGGATVIGGTLELQAFINGAYRTLHTLTTTGSTGPNLSTIIDWLLDNTDDDDGTGQKVSRASYVAEQNGTGDWDAGFTGTGSVEFTGINQAGAATSIRLQVSGTGDFDVSEGAPNFKLYGIKRTQP